MEIYNESLKDLLTLQPLEIKQSKEGVFVPCLEEVEVKNADDVRRVRVTYIYFVCFKKLLFLFL